MKAVFSVRGASLFVGAVLSCVAGCSAGVDCERGELRYDGRPPRHLFSYEPGCRTDCFSFRADCTDSCPDIRLESPKGMIIENRWLVLADMTSLGDDRALVFVFGYEDEADGEDPYGWGIADAPGSYRVGQVEGNARFIGETLVAQYQGSGDDAATLLGIFDATGETVAAEPGQLDVNVTSETRIAGEFFLGFKSPTDQPQGQVNGCFDLSLGSPEELGGFAYRMLRP